MVVPDFDGFQLGNIQTGRPNLGGETKVAVYRLMIFSLRAVLVKEYGDTHARHLLVEAGRMAGAGFCRKLMDTSLPLSAFIAQLHQRLLELSVGILKVEKADPDTMTFVVTISEDLDCSGLPVGGGTVCDYDEGFLAGVFGTYAGRPFVAKEVDCWSTGEHTCRFIIEPES